MPYIPGQGAFSYLDNLQQQADQAQQDALLAQQQAAAYAQQQQAETEAYRQQLDDMLAQQQASYDQALQQMQQPTPAVSAAGASAVDGTVQTTGNPLVDRFIAESGNTQFMPEGGATYFNNKAVDDWLDREAARNGWNATKRAVERKKLTDALVKLTGNSRLFEVEDRGFTGLVGDFANRAVGTTVTGLMDLVGVASTYVGETMNNVGLGDGRLDASRAVLEASEGAKRMFRSARSYESQDNERAFEMTGMGDMLDVLAYNPSGLTDFAGDLVGIVFGPGAVGKGVSAGGKAILRSGATAAAAAGGKVTPAAAKAFGLSDEILRGGGAKIGELTGISGLVNRQAVGARIIGAGETLTDITRTIGFQAALEGTSNAADILRQNGAYNAQTGTYNGDVLNAAAVAGGLTGGVTYGLGRFLPTAEGSLLRMANATRAEASTLGRMVMKGETTIDDALKAVSTDLQQGMLSPEARSVLSEISERLTTEQGKAALMNAVDKGSIFRTVLAGAKPLTSGMMSEGFEEGLVGLISSAAAQSVSGDGNFSWDKIDWARAATDAGKAAVVGALMGTAVGGLKLAHDYRDANTNLDKAIAEYQEKVNGMMADNDAQVAAYESALTNAGGINPLGDTPLNVLMTTPSDVQALTAQVRSNAAAANAAAGLQQNMPVDVLRLPPPGQTSPAELAVYNPARRRLETLAEWQAADNAAREHNAQLDVLAEQIVHEQPIDEMVLDVLANPTGAARQALNVHENLNASGRSRAASAFNLHALNEQTVRDALTRSAEQVDYEVRQLRELGLRDNVPDTVLKDIEQAAYISDGFSTVEEMVNRMGDSVGYIPQNVRNNIALLSKIDKAVAILSDPDLPANERAVVADSVAVIRSNPSLNRRLQATYDWVVNKFGAMVGKPVLPAFDRVAETARREASLAKPKADVRLSDTTTVSSLLKPLGVDSKTIKALSDQVNKIKSTSRGKNSVRAAVMNYIEASIVTEQDADVEAYREQAYQKVFDYYNSREDDGEAVSDLTRTFFEGSDNPPEVGLDRLLEEAVDDVIRAKYTRRAEVAADEAKKLGLTPSVTLDGSDAAAIADTARAMERNGKTVTADLFSAPALPAVDLRPADKIPAVDLFSPSAEAPRAPQGKRASVDLFSETPTDVQAAFDAQAEADLAALDKRFGKRDLFSDDFDSFNDYDDFDVSSYARYQRSNRRVFSEWAADNPVENYAEQLTVDEDAYVRAWIDADTRAAWAEQADQLSRIVPATQVPHRLPTSTAIDIETRLAEQSASDRAAYLAKLDRLKAQGADKAQKDVLLRSMRTFLVNNDVDTSAPILDKYAEAVMAGRTVLPFKQYVAVRTPQFKAWFGDWENNPAAASKVVHPTTGEPMMVYHATNARFTQFNTPIQYFTPEADYYYANNRKHLLRGFVNMRNPMYVDNGTVEFIGMSYNADRWQRDMQAGYDGYIYLSGDDLADYGDKSRYDGGAQVVTMSPTAFKSVHNNGDYSPENPNFTRSKVPAKWDTMTETEQTLAVQQETIRRATNAISAAFGKDFMRHVVFVSPNSQSLADSNTTAYVLDGDPSTVYVVADPTRADHQFVYSVAHEMLHQHADVAVRGKTTQWGDYKQTMDKFAQHPFVQELMGAMRYTYPELDSYALAEEALAEIHAARTSPKGWDTLRETWGINTKPPTDLRAKSSGLMAQIINWFKRMVAQWRGKPRTTDAELAEFFRVVSQSRPDAAAQVRTPEAAQQYRARMEFEAARQRSDYYHGMARDITPDFDTLPAQQQRSILTDLAQRNGDELSAQELGLQVRYAKRPYGSESGESTVGDQPKKHAGAPHAEPYPDGTVERLFREQAEQAAQIPPSSDRDGQRHMAHKLVRQLNIYLNRAPDAEYNADVHGVPVGLISLVNSGDNTAEVRVIMNDPDNGVVGVMHTEPVKGDIDGAMYSAWEWLNTTYPAQYSRPSGTTIDPRTGSQLTPSELYVLNRADYMGLTSPRVREWTNWLREKLPAQYIPVLDAFLDFVSALRTRWVDVYTSMKEVELAYEKATGKPSNVITRMQRDIGEGMAFLHRNFNAGSVVETAGKQQSMRDRTEAIRDAMLREGVPQERINKFLYGLEEAVRYNQFMNSPQSEGHWAEREDGTKYIVNRNNGGEALSVTGFNFRDLNTLDPNIGQADLGARRFLAALAGMNVEERNRIGRIVAEVSAANRTVIELQHQRGVLNKTDYTNRMRRGKRELDAAFPELAAQGYDFSGFFITMRDDDSSAFTTRDSKGRTTAVENVLGNTAAVWEADVKKAFRNNEMAQFALLVMSMPNRHFAIEPVTPVANPDDPTGAPLWEESTKGEKGSTVVYINGVPVRLVAKSKTAAMMFDAEAMHPAIAKVGSLNHYFNQFKTSLNPSYPVVGFVRDMMTGYLNISGAIGEQYVSSKDAAAVGTRAVGYALRYLFVPNKGNLFYGTWRGEQGDVWAQVYQRLGAGMLFGDNVNTGAFANINNNPLVSGKVGRATDVLSSAYDKTRSAAARVAETIAYPPETAMRLGVFRAYAEHLLGSQLKPNMTADQIVDLFDQVKSPQNSDYAAAIIVGSKNITSNFQQHGTDSVVRNLFSFHNAVMQGTFATLPQILSTEHGRKASALLLIGAAAAAAAAIGSEDEDEFGNSKYFQNLKRNRSIILGDVAVPIPDEIGWIKNLSDNIVGVMMGKRNIIDASVDQLHASAEMVTTQQWGDTDNAFTNALFAVTPTMAQPLIAISSGHDVFGRKLKNDFAYDAQGKRISYAADVERTTPRATTVGTSLAEFLYGATGGGVDMTGDEVDVVGRSLLGGIYTSFSRTQTESMRSGDGVVSTAGSELVHGIRAIKIDRRSDDAWKDLGERLGVSQRHEGGMMDVLNSKDHPETAEAYKLYRRGDERSRKAKSDMGYSYKQLHDMIGKAEAEGRYQDVRDLRADMRTIKVNRDEIRREVMAEINALGVK